MRADGTVVGVVVGIDGCGKTSTFRDSVAALAGAIPVVGVGESVLRGTPGGSLVEATDVPLTRSSRVLGKVAKGLRRPTLYKELKFLEFIERTHIRDHVIAHDRPAALLSDGDPLVNIAAWAAARFYRDELAGRDDELLDVLRYMAGDRRIPLGELPRYTCRAWQLVLLNRLHAARFRFPDEVFLLQIDPAVAMDRIQGRGQPLQAHENEAFLGELAAAYEKVCSVLESRCGVPVVRIPVGRQSHEESVQMVVDAMLDQVARREEPGPSVIAADSIEIIATTMSGSIQDQRKVSMIEPEFRSRVARPTHVHLARSHPEASAIARRIVAGGGRTLVSAGGAGTFNAVLEGSLVGDDVPRDLRLAFLRKGSADLIGKAMHIPDDLAGAAEAIIDGIVADRCIDADIVTIQATESDGTSQRRHIVGFGGLGAFGEVPRFTETRIIKWYKGILGSLFGDLGPFFVGLMLAVGWWWLHNLLGRVPPLVLTLDGDELPAERWGAVMLLNGDLGKDFPLGRGLSLSSGSFRVVALRYRGARSVVRQIAACRTGTVLDDPDAYSALVADVRRLEARPSRPCPSFMVNVDGLRLMTQGTVEAWISGRVRLVAGRSGPEPE